MQDCDSDLLTYKLLPV